MQRAQNLAMPNKSTRKAGADTTPAGRLREAALRGVIGYQIAQASVVANRLYDQAVARPLGLHRLEFSILLLVQENPGCTAARLAHALGISTPNMALWLERVTSKGLIERLPSASDRRAVPLQLSARGEHLAQTALAAIKAAEAQGLDALSDAERAMLAELLHKAALHRPGKGP